MTAFSGHIKETSSDCSASDTYQASPSDLINNFIQGKIIQLLRQKTHRVTLVSAFSPRLAPFLSCPRQVSFVSPVVGPDSPSGEKALVIVDLLSYQRLRIYQIVPRCLHYAEIRVCMGVGHSCGVSWWVWRCGGVGRGEKGVSGLTRYFRKAVLSMPMGMKSCSLGYALCT